MRITMMILAAALVLGAASIRLAADTDEQSLESRCQQAFGTVSALVKDHQYREALAILEQLRDTPGMLAPDDRRMLVSYGLVYAHAQLGEKEKALRYLSGLLDAGLLRDWVLEAFSGGNPDLDAFAREPEVKRLLIRAAPWKSFWRGEAFSTPYRPNLSDDEKVAGLSRLWSEVKYNFAYFERLPDLDWDALYLANLPKVKATKTTLEYYRVLQHFCAALQDSHTSVSVPEELKEAIEARPPLDTQLIEGRVLVAGVYDEGLALDGIRPGLEIVAVDGLPVRRHAEQHVKPYLSASTPQIADVAIYEYYLLCGAKGQSVELTLQDSGGATLTRSIRRLGSAETKSQARPPFEFRMLEGNTAYVGLNTLEDEEVVRQFASHFPEISRAQALIIDLRRNGGGNSDVGWRILAYLTGKPFATHHSVARKYDPYARARGWDPWTSVTGGAEPQSPHVGEVFRGPVAVLTGAHTGSAAEDFCVAFDAMKRGPIIGEPTAGSTGQPLSFGLPGGGSARVCTIKVTYPDGKEFVGTGVQPTVLARPTVSDFRTGRDSVLEAALEYLRKRLGSADGG